jgi:predicted GIY-YIG superfamily endonuclease
MKHWVYFLIHSNKVIYIGVTKDWRRRIREHFLDGRNFDTFRAIECDNFDTAAHYERRWIRKFKPTLNKNGYGASTAKCNMTILLPKKVVTKLKLMAVRKRTSVSIMVENALETSYGI